MHPKRYCSKKSYRTSKQLIRACRYITREIVIQLEYKVRGASHGRQGKESELSDKPYHKIK